jgi:protein-S-isoprenylcysteine O-methyltransferase Ste14
VGKKIASAFALIGVLGLFVSVAFIYWNIALTLIFLAFTLISIYFEVRFENRINNEHSETGDQI